MRRAPLLHPVGPLPAAVYWRRRVVVVVVLLVVIVAAVMVLRALSAPDRVTTGSGDLVSGAVPTPPPSPAGSASGPGSSTPPQPRASALASRAAEDPRAADGAPEASAGAVAASAGPGEPGDCSPDDVRVTVAVAPEEVPVGGEVVFAVQVQAEGAQCRLDVGPVARSAEVRTGGERVWSTEDCEAGTRTETVVVGPDAPLEIVIRWDGRRTAPGCPAGLPEAGPGDYAVDVQVGPGSSGAVPFRLV